VESFRQFRIILDRFPAETFLKINPVVNCNYQDHRNHTYKEDLDIALCYLEFLHNKIVSFVIQISYACVIRRLTSMSSTKRIDSVFH